tara:strand:+ start:12932 stop:13705 length:774 start_codon:yes stop_codon:yes gene_type:complete
VTFSEGSEMNVKPLLQECISSYASHFSKLHNKPELDKFRLGIGKLLNEISVKNIKQKNQINVPKKVVEYLNKCSEVKKFGGSLENSLLSISNKLDWYKIINGTNLDKKLVNGLFAAQLCGSRGLIKSDEIYLGLFLLAPNLLYPLHQHEALELYHVCAGNIEISHGRKKNPFKVSQGNFSLTPSNQVHSLRTGPDPCLFSYIWVADEKKLPGKSWWWQENSDGFWSRISWERQADSSWKISGSERLTEELIKEAGDY